MRGRVADVGEPSMVVAWGVRPRAGAPGDSRRGGSGRAGAGPRAIRVDPAARPDELRTDLRRDGLAPLFRRRGGGLGRAAATGATGGVDVAAGPGTAPFPARGRGDGAAGWI